MDYTGTRTISANFVLHIRCSGSVQFGHATEQFPTLERYRKWGQRLLYPLSHEKAVNYHRWYSMVEDYT